jgi:uncharacterized protein YoxC
MNNCADAVFPIILYFLASILLVALIVLVVRLIRTLGKVDRVVEDVSYKASKLNGVFHLIDNATDTLSIVSDKVVNVVANGITNFFNKKEKKKEDE